MLHLIGKPYIMQHCIIASRREKLDISYMAYMTDALASFAGMSERWYDRVESLVENRPQPPQPSADEVIARIKNGLNGGDGT